MKFTTHERLDKEKDINDLKEEEVQRRFSQLIDIICTEIQQNIYSKEKKYVWRNLHLARNLHTSIPTETDEYLHRFVDKLNQTFVGCDIIMDPLKKYVVIDWS
jgi:hypothetical protein